MSVIHLWNSGNPMSFGRCHKKRKKWVSASDIALSGVCPRGSRVDFIRAKLCQKRKNTKNPAKP